MAIAKELKMAEETTSKVEATMREIRRRSRKKYSAEEKVRIVLEGLRRGRDRRVVPKRRHSSEHVL